MFTDPVADMLTRIRNGYLAGKKVVPVPYSKLKKAVASLLVNEGYLKSAEVEGKKPTEKQLKLDLRYSQGRPAIVGIKRLSKPGLRRYARADKIPPVRWGIGITVLSTSAGVMTDKEARKKNLGGEILCQVW